MSEFAVGNLGDSSASARASCCPTGAGAEDRCCFIGSPLLRPISSSSSVPSVPFTMHDAYDYKPVLEKLPLHIEAIACYGNDAAISRRAKSHGHLLVNLAVITSYCTFHEFLSSEVSFDFRTH